MWQRILVLGASSAVLLVSTAHADAVQPERPHLTVGIGVSAMSLGWFGPMPWPWAVSTSVDVRRRVRIHVSLVHREHLLVATAGAGVVLSPMGRRTPHTGGVQIKIPILLEAGSVYGTTEAHDGYDDYHEWLTLGPSTGAEMTMWKADRMGFTVGLKLGYLVRIDLGSDYPDGYTEAGNPFGALVTALTLGVSL